MTIEEIIKALNGKEDCIVIEGDKANDVYRIIATGNVAWAIAIGAIGLSAALIFITVGSGGAAAPVTVPVEVASKMFIAPAAVAVVGWSATSTAIAICFAAGGVAAGKAILNAVRNNYKIAEKVEDKDGKVIRLALKRK
jgi:hypothetical protein